MQFESQTVEQILLVARDITAKVPYCWAVTADQRGGANARVVQPFFSQLDQDGWVVRFLTSGSSRKAAEILTSGRISLGYQYDPEQACITLVGAARIIDDRAYLQDKWRTEWNAFFPKGPSDVDAVIVEVTVERIEMYNLVRRIAAPPNGLRAATLQRAASGGWQSLNG
ncbi:MAG: pyridoxamine 5-phosphate oxidase-related, FMN-binding protein [Gammaproteobacteria bacterium]|nr:pyridoxamine 5-phosphate oxidase-related, FMN-binding protein [Gammaproteobacteria bacterium]